MEKNKFIYYIGLVLLLVLFVLKPLLKISKIAYKDKLENLNTFNWIIGIIFPLLGITLIFGTYEQYDYLVDDMRYKFFKKIFGETGVKIFYYFLGLMLIYWGIKLGFMVN